MSVFLNTDTDPVSVFFRLNTDNDTSVFKRHSEYVLNTKVWILLEVTSEK